MSNNKLLNLSLRIERRRVPLHTQHTCSADPPLQNNYMYAIHGSQDLKYQLLNKLKAPQSMCFKINNQVAPSLCSQKNARDERN